MIPSGNDAANLLSQVIGYFSKKKYNQEAYVDLT